MKTFYLTIILMMFQIEVIRSLDMRLDFGANLKMNGKIQLVVKKTISSLEQIFIYYADNTISRYTNSLQLISSVSLPSLSNISASIAMQNFNVYNGSNSCYYGILSGGKQIVIIDINDSSKVKRIQGFGQLKYVEVLSFTYLGEPEILVIDNNKIWKEVNKTKQYLMMIPNFMSFVNTVKNVSTVQNNGLKNYLIITIFNEIYLFNVSLQNTTYTLSNITLLRKLNDSIVSFSIDKRAIIWLQLPNSTLSVFNFLTNITYNFTPEILSKISIGQLRSFQADNLQDGERFLVLDSKAMKVNLTLLSYSFISQIFFDRSNWTGMMLLESNSSILYTKDFDNVSSFQYSPTPITATCGQSDLCFVPNCNLCSGNGSNCIDCESDYVIFNQVCYLFRQCTEIQNCRVCDFFINGSCLECNVGYMLDSTINSCVFINITNNTVPNNTNTTTNTTNMTTNTIKNTTITPNITNNTNNIDNQTIPKQEPSDLQVFFENCQTAVGELNRVPGIRIILPFMLPLFGCLDDFWYYIYHQDSYPQLRYIPSYLAFMYQSNKNRMVMDELNFQDRLKFQFSQYFGSNFSIFTFPTIFQIDGEQTFLLKNFEDFYQQFIQMLIGVIFLKILVFIIRYLFLKNFKKNTKVVDHNLTRKRFTFTKNQQINNSHSESKIILKITEYITKILTPKSILIMLIGSNLIFVSFTYSCQLNVFFFFNFSDKSNGIASILVGFIMLSFSIIILLYSDLFIIKTKKLKTFQNFGTMVHSLRQNDFKSNEAYYQQERSQQLFMTYFAHLKCIFYGFIQGYFIRQPSVQYILLLCVKLFLIFMIYGNKNIENQKYVRICMITYFLAGILLDFLCLLSKNMLIPSGLSEIFINQVSIIDGLEISCLGLIFLSILMEIFLGIVIFIKGKLPCFKKKSIRQNSLHIACVKQNDPIFDTRRNFGQIKSISRQSIQNRNPPSNRTTFELIHNVKSCRFQESKYLKKYQEINLQPTSFRRNKIQLTTNNRDSKVLNGYPQKNQQNVRFRNQANLNTMLIFSPIQKQKTNNLLSDFEMQSSSKQQFVNRNQQKHINILKKTGFTKEYRKFTRKKINQ